MKPADIKQKARNKANAMAPLTKTFHFEDKRGNPCSCQVTIPAERFSYSITRRVADNLLKTLGKDLPFTIMRPVGVNEDDDWKEVTIEDQVQDSALPKQWSVFEIWLPAPTDDLGDMFQSPGAK